MEGQATPDQAHATPTYREATKAQGTAARAPMTTSDSTTAIGIRQTMAKNKELDNTLAKVTATKHTERTTDESKTTAGATETLQDSHIPTPNPYFHKDTDTVIYEIGWDQGILDKDHRRTTLNIGNIYHPRKCCSNTG